MMRADERPRGSSARPYLQSLEALRSPQALEGQPFWLSSLRRESFDRFAAAGLPTTKQEAWKYTSLEPLDDVALHYLRSRGLSGEEARRALVSAFAAEVIEEVHVAPLRERIAQWSGARFPVG